MCPVISSNKTQLICQIADNSGLIGGSVYPINVQIKNTGYAIKRDLFTLTFISSITSITPNMGIRLIFMYPSWKPQDAHVNSNTNRRKEMNTNLTNICLHHTKTIDFFAFHIS